MIYLASPYSHPDKAVEARRYADTVRAFAALCRAGYTVISPIVMCHVPATTCGLPTDAAWWEAFNLEIMCACDKCVVLCIEGYVHSVGVLAEVRWYSEQDREIGWMDPQRLPETGFELKLGGKVEVLR